DDGSIVCICLTSTDVNGWPTSYQVEWRKLDSSGATLATHTIGTFTGSRDPRAQSPDAFQNALIELSEGPGNTVYVGWSTRDHPVWHSGLIAVDLGLGSVLGQLTIGDRGDGSKDAPLVQDGPIVAGSAGPDRLLVDQGWYTFSPPTTSMPIYQPGFDGLL